jgi:hypothetical protein
MTCRQWLRTCQSLPAPPANRGDVTDAGDVIQRLSLLSVRNNDLLRSSIHSILWICTNGLPVQVLHAFYADQGEETRQHLEPSRIS